MMLEHLVLLPEGGLCNRLRAIASAKRICSISGAHCTVVWDWGDYRALFEDQTEWISKPQLEDWKRSNLLTDYYRIRHLHPHEGGNDGNRQIPTRSYRGIILTSNYIFSALDEPAIGTGTGERVVRPWIPNPHRIVREKVDAFRQANFAARTVGLHIRGTDHQRARLRSPAESYWKFADRLVNDGYLLFLATDNTDTLEMMQRRYGSKLLHHPKSSAMRERWPRTESQLTDIIDDLVDLWLLAVCDFVIGSASSSFSGIAIALNGSSKCKAIDKRQIGDVFELHRWRGLFARLFSNIFRRGVVTSPHAETVSGLAENSLNRSGQSESRSPGSSIR